MSENLPTSGYAACGCSVVGNVTAPCAKHRVVEPVTASPPASYTEPLDLEAIRRRVQEVQRRVDAGETIGCGTACADRAALLAEVECLRALQPSSSGAVDRERLAKMADDMADVCEREAEQWDRRSVDDDDQVLRDFARTETRERRREATDWRTIAALLREGSATEGWRTMESAPKDGTAVQIGWSDGEAVPECARFNNGAWREANYYDMDSAPEFLPPTAWRPLPSPPTSPDADLSGSSTQTSGSEG